MRQQEIQPSSGECSQMLCHLLWTLHHNYQISSHVPVYNCLLSGQLLFSVSWFFSICFSQYPENAAEQLSIMLPQRLPRSVFTAIQWDIFSPFCSYGRVSWLVLRIIIYNMICVSYDVNCVVKVKTNEKKHLPWFCHSEIATVGNGCEKKCEISQTGITSFFNFLSLKE